MTKKDADLTIADIQGVDKKDIIRRAAFKLLMNKGFSKTSYSDIAETSGCTRALVQYYFPKKEELLNDFMARLLILSDKHLVNRGLKTDSCFIDFYITGYMHFFFLLENDTMLPLTSDIIDRRTHSQTALSLMVDWMNHYEELACKDTEDITAAIFMTVGGAYEYIAYQLDLGKNVDIPLLLERTIGSFIHLLGFNEDDFMARHALHLLSEDDIRTINACLLQEMAS
ncbi:TetR/AcrR family transcriptional regulator [Adlercreutzia sp. ZJ154]|uniref:TetR/AcrR family transcriptional regulator n=1 Tax=Adlercreutzia sp. ZJ154 TaxID=2709790 RepID=UPI0013ECB996|nr:helix-turn-helix domain-containing protein [Adlercreutzia sp. ZJ154]